MRVVELGLGKWLKDRHVTKLTPVERSAKYIKPWSEASPELQIIKNRLYRRSRQATEVDKLDENTKVEAIHDTNQRLEIAFVGRSNVGKSTLLNSICRRELANTSTDPGTTRSLHFYKLGGKMTVVDLPGYGFTYHRPEKYQKWVQLTQRYLTERKSLRRLYLLLDSRHGIKTIDRAMMDWLDEYGTCKYQVILTKCDLVPQEDLCRRLQLTEQEMKQREHGLDEVLMVSSKLLRARVSLEHLKSSICKVFLGWESVRRPGVNVIQTMLGSSDRQKANLLAGGKMSLESSEAEVRPYYPGLPEE